PAGDARYRDRRLMVLFFDATASPQADLLRSFTAADKFIRTQMKGPDLVAIITFANGVVNVVQDFTDNQEQLLGLLQKLMYPDENDDTANTAGAFGPDCGQLNRFNTEPQLPALQTPAST